MDSSLNSLIQEECHKDIDQQYTNDGWQDFCKQKDKNIIKMYPRSISIYKLEHGQGLVLTTLSISYLILTNKLCDK